MDVREMHSGGGFHGILSWTCLVFPGATSLIGPSVRSFASRDSCRYHATAGFVILRPFHHDPDVTMDEVVSEQCQVPPR